MDYTELNKAQAKAVKSNSNRILCLAGAGSGKTRVLTHRIARICEEGVKPYEILALTFTRAAGHEMKERIISLVGDEGKDIFCNTYHAWALLLIRQYPYMLGLNPGFTIYDQEDQVAIIDQIIRDMNYKIKTKDVVEAIDKHNRYYAPIPRGEIGHTVTEYRFRCRKNNAIDLDGLIGGLRILAKHPRIREEIRERWPYIFVDEFQDTDQRQMELLDIIDPQNLFVVGDDFQSIYGFRGADVSIIMGLAEDPAYEVIKLEDNYRSTKPIVCAANNLIKHNKQTEKTLKAHRKGTYIAQIDAEDEEEELDAVCHEIKKMHEAGTAYKDIAILARTNKKVQAAADELKKQEIPHTIKTTTADVLMTQDAKKLCAWMTAILNPQDDEAVSQVVNWPEQTISRNDKLKAEMFQLEHDCSLKTALEATGTATEWLETYQAIKSTIVEEYDEYDEIGASDLLEYVIDATRIREYYDERGLSNRNAVILEIHEIVRLWQEQRADHGESITAQEWLDYFKTRWVDRESIKEETEDEVQVMTAHGSKGLEYHTVFIIGCNQGSFPLARADIEEERRLFYVAITRAKERLIFSYPKTQKSWGDTQKTTETSIFLKEI